MDAILYSSGALVYALRWTGITEFVGFYAVACHTIGDFDWRLLFTKAVVDDFGNLVRVE